MTDHAMGVNLLVLLLLLSVVSVYPVQERPEAWENKPEGKTQCPAPCMCAKEKVYCDSMALSMIPRALPGDILTLSMSNNRLWRLRQKDLTGLSQLRHLMLKGNRISRIEPQALKDMYELQALSLSENALKRLSPNTFRWLPKLQVLSMRLNKLTNIERLFYHTVSLKLLNLGGNKVRYITQKTFKNNFLLTVLDLNDNRIKHIDQDAFKSLPLLKYLVLRDNPLKTLQLDFGFNQHLELLDLTNCKLSEVVKGLPYSINDLRLAENQITEIQATDFQSIKKIRLLVLSNNRIKTIADETFSHLSQLYDLYLGGNLISEVPKNLPRSLNALYMNYNNISRLERYQFSRCNKLKELMLSNNRISSVDSRALRGLESLRSLDLSHNQLRIVEPMTFADNNQLEKLDISHNPLLELSHYCFHGLEQLNILQMSSVHTDAKLLPVVFQDTPELSFLDASSSPTLAAQLVNEPQYLTSVEDLNLMNNTLRVLPARLPDFMPQLHMIKLSNNPWHCNASIYPLALWMRNRTVDFHEEHTMKCASPTRLKGRFIAELMPEDLDPPTTTQRPEINIDLGNLVPQRNYTRKTKPLGNQILKVIAKGKKRTRQARLRRLRQRVQHRSKLVMGDEGVTMSGDSDPMEADEGFIQITEAYSMEINQN